MKTCLLHIIAAALNSNGNMKAFLEKENFNAKRRR